jgi:hypothetical protein
MAESTCFDVSAWSQGSDMVQVLSRVKRILRYMGKFNFFDAESFHAPEGLPLNEGEVPIGAYLNNPNSLEGAVVVTDSSLLVESGGSWTPIHYASIAKVETPDSKTGVHGLHLHLRDGSTAYIPIQGGTERTSDAFEFLRFLNRVLADQPSAAR